MSTLATRRLQSVLVLALTLSLFSAAAEPTVASSTDNSIFSIVLTKNDPSRAKIGTYVQLENGNILFARHTPAKPGKKTIVLMNGLPDGLANWRALEPDLIAMGYGVLAFDFRGQENTLIFNGTNFGDLHWRTQVEDVRQLLQFFNIQEKVVVSGLSYGGGIALAFSMTHPDLIAKTIVFAPFIEPVQPQDDQLQEKVNEHMKNHPGDDAKAYFEDLFRYTVYTSYPATEPSLLTHPLKLEGVTRMALGIRDFDPISMVGNMPANSLSVVGGAFDTAVPLSVISRLWKSAPTRVQQAALVIQTGHRITTWRPELSAKIIDHLVRNDKRTLGGKVINVDEDNRKLFSSRASFVHDSKVTCEEIVF